MVVENMAWRIIRTYRNILILWTVHTLDLRNLRRSLTTPERLQDSLSSTLELVSIPLIIAGSWR